jgi:hypothetical protein
MEDAFGSTFTLLQDYLAWTPPDLTRKAVLVLTLVMSAVLTTVTAGSRLFTMPIAYAVLYVAGMFSNFLFRGVHIGALNDAQLILVFTSIGQCLVVLPLVMVLGVRTNWSKL